MATVQAPFTTAINIYKLLVLLLSTITNLTSTSRLQQLKAPSITAMASSTLSTEDLMKLSSRARQAMGTWFDHEMEEMHPRVSELSTFVVPSLKSLNLPVLEGYLQEHNIDVVVLQALDKELKRIHRKVGSLTISKHATAPTVEATTGWKEAFQRTEISLHWQEYELFKLAKAPHSDHVDTVQFFIKHFPKRTMLNEDGSTIMTAERRAESLRKKHTRRKRALKRARKLMPGQAEHARNQERFELRKERKAMHERIKLGRRDGTLTTEAAKDLASMYTKESQLEMLEAKRKMREQGIEPETGDGPFDEEIEEDLVDDGTFEAAEGLEDGEEMSSGDERQAPEPVLME